MNPCPPHRSPPDDRSNSGSTGAPASAGLPWLTCPCVTGQLADGTTQPLLRLRYGGYANQWGFAIWLASRDAYQDSVLPSGMPVGTAEEALDCACGLYLNDPTTWQAE